MKTVNLGIDLSFAKKRWPEPEAWMAIVRDRLGLEYVEFDSDFLDPFYVSEPARSEIAGEICALARRNGIVIHNYYTGTMTHCVNLLSHPDPRVRRDGRRWCEEAMRLAAKLGAGGIGGHFDTISSRACADPVLYRRRIEDLVRTFRELSRVARAEGNAFMLLEQMYTPAEAPYTMAQARMMLEEMNRDAEVPIKLTLDVGHACCQHFRHDPEDRDPYAWIRAFAPQSPVIHIHQTTATESCHWPFTEAYNSKGIIHAERVMEALEASGAEEVLLVLEVFFPLAWGDDQVLAAVQASVEYWQPHARPNSAARAVAPASAGVP
jgi:sugar phosphate isomerase/epimerase